MSRLSHFTRSTIYSLASHISNRGSPLALIRISGPDSHPAVQHLIRKPLTPRCATLCKLRDPLTGDLIDRGIATYFPEPRSYTGEHVCELMVHGSQAVVARLLTVLGERDGLRPAEPGEFTKRALLNGKLDLTTAEAVKDLIESRTETQRKRALDALSGRTSDLYRNWRARMVKCLADVDANIEFGEDQLLDEETFANLKSSLVSLRDEIADHVTHACQKSEMALQGFKVVILGEPNVGKSSLINALTSRDVSIVSSLKGTTRDVVDVVLDMKGHLITLSDTAGLREMNAEGGSEADAIEKEGMRRAMIKGTEAHLILSITDHQSLPLHSQIQQILRLNDQVSVLNVRNKCDLLPDEDCIPTSSSTRASDCIISCKTGHGIDELQALILSHVQKLYSQSQQGFMTQRQSSHLRNVVHYMDQSLPFLVSDVSVAAHYMRKAAIHLSSLTDVITGDQVLDLIFRDFCIGK